MYYGNIVNYDIANGAGLRVSLFVSGCTHHCKECFNEKTWDFNYGEPYTPEVKEHILGLLNQNGIKGLTVLGGEPFEKANQKDVYELVKAAKERNPEQTVWIYSGYLYEELRDKYNIRVRTEYTDKLLDIIDVLVDGEFEIENKDLMLKYKGSTNQRVILVPKTIEKGEVVVSEVYNQY